MAPMDVDLTLNLILEHAVTRAGEVEVVTRDGSGALRRYTYGAMGGRVARLMNALPALGLGPGDVAATLAVNSERHLEAYFGIPCAGRVLHTLNPRLSPEHLGHVIEKARDKVIFADPDMLPLLGLVAGSLGEVQAVVVLADHVPEAATGLPSAVAYDDVLAAASEDYAPPAIDERAPLGICFTTGTTGLPKGVVYSHRSAVLHAMAIASGAGIGIGPEDCACAMVPMFHANCFGLPHAAALVGAKQVLYGGSFEPGAFVDLLKAEEVTFSAAVPTIWHAVAADMRARGIRLPDLKLTVTAGAQPPASLVDAFWDEFRIPMVQAFGMTEASPVVGLCHPKHHMRGWDAERRDRVVRRQAAIPFAGVQVSLRADDGSEVPWDGSSMGALHLRGPWIIGEYLDGDAPEKFTDDGWFDTGDIAIGSPGGYMVIADRTKDLVKSGGEWISSVDMENAIMGMAAVVEAAVIAIPDPKWDERPLPCVVPADGAGVSIEEMRAHLEAAGFPRWQLPERHETLEALPRTSVGKIDKKALREKYAAAGAIQ
jgi:acyl-CoA synthetase (AMP-forming)/AMP-acid ligase II